MRPALPALHVVTSDAVLADDGFLANAGTLIEARGAGLALHLRGPGTPARRLHALAAALVSRARAHGALLLVNDRADVALAVGAHGVQLGRRSLPAAAARRLNDGWLVGSSVHGTAEAEAAAGADFLVVGTIWATPSHPGRPGAGPALLGEVRRASPLPVIAIGGITPARAREARRAGADGVAVVRGIWGAADPVAAAAAYESVWTDETGGGA